ncbi:hypothetical protein SK128_020038 [Halocaridina rubra]|uniref:Coiled-coil domain-containing protein 40 n=1 Tax=Halocaridina rubra TaxID=373956 RepID=A0AAN8XD46_HALRR
MDSREEVLNRGDEEEGGELENVLMMENAYDDNVDEIVHDAQQQTSHVRGDEEAGQPGGVTPSSRVISPVISLPPSSPGVVDDGMPRVPAGGPSWNSVLDTLGPDHPLLKGFQEAKRRQFKQEKSQLQLRLRQLNQQTGDLQQENITLGAQLYDIQQSITRVQVNLDRAKVERQKVISNRVAAEDALQQARQEESNLLQNLHQAKIHQSRLKRELATSGAQLATVKQFKEQSDGNITTVTRALHNTAWDRASLEKDKMAQDMLVERLTISLDRERTTLASLQQSTIDVSELTKALQQRARLQQAELQQLELEGVGVRRAWESNVLLLEKRSHEQSDAYKLLQELLGQLAGQKTELYNGKKAVKAAQMEHERDSLRLLRHEREVLDRREKLTFGREEAQLLAEKHEALINIVETLEGQHQHLLKESHEEDRKLEGIYRNLKITTERHRRLEDLALDKIGEHTAVSKAANNIRRRIKNIRIRCRSLEDELIENERSAADAALKSSDCRAAVLAQVENKDAAKQVVDKLDADINRLESELKRGQEKISTNQCAVDRLNKDLAKALELAGGSEVPPVEREERRLRILLQDQEAEKTKLEEEALSVQRNLLDARRTREILDKERTKLHQEVHVLYCRQARLKGIVEKEQGAFQEAMKTQERLHKGVATLDARLHHEKNAREELSRESDVSESQLMAKLKELNEEAQRKHNFMQTLKSKKEDIEGELLEASQRRMEWEKNLIEIREAKDTLRKETGTEGDLHVMKMEINRMHARWRALEVTQKELSSQLEQSVTVETAIKSRALATVAKLRRDPNSANATRFMHQDILERKVTRAKKPSTFQLVPPLVQLLLHFLSGRRHQDYVVCK